MFNRRVLATAIGAVAVVGVLASCSSGVSGSAQGLANSIQEVVDSASAAASAIEKAAGEVCNERVRGDGDDGRRPPRRRRSP